MKKYKIICIVLTTILVCIAIGYIGIRVFDRVKIRVKIRQEITSKLTEEELSNVNLNELVEDIIGGIKYAKRVEASGKYEGNGYTIRYYDGDECIGRIYYCGDKEVYSTFVLVPYGTVFSNIEYYIEENKGKFVCIIFITILIIADIIYCIKYKKSRKQVY